MGKTFLVGLAPLFIIIKKGKNKQILLGTHFLARLGRNFFCKERFRQEKYSEEVQIEVDEYIKIIE